MKTIKVYYAKIPNMGDLLNEYIIEAVTGYPTEHCQEIGKFDLMGIGSYADALFTGKPKQIYNPWKDYVKEILCIRNKPYAVWGTGFHRDFTGCNLKLIRKNCKILAVRGEKSKALMPEQLISDDIVLCDGGILSNLVVEKSVIKKYEIGVIPHYKEIEMLQQMGILQRLADKYKSVKMIDLRGDPKQVLKDISDCEYIISSSLHGCIVADCYGIPNLRIYLSDAPGTGFKFLDYYSSFGQDGTYAYQLNENAPIPTVNDIVDHYQITQKEVEKKQTEMYKVLNSYFKSVL